MAFGTKAVKRVNPGQPMQHSPLRRVQNSMRSYGGPRITPVAGQRDYSKVTPPKPMEPNSSPFFNTGMTGET